MEIEYFDKFKNLEIKHNIPKIKKNPKLFEYDKLNKIVDIFIRKDPNCPYPFHAKDWYHQGFDLDNFLIFVSLFLEEIGISSKFEIKE